MIGRVSVDVFEQHFVAGANDPRATLLGDTFSGLVNLVAAFHSFACRSPRSGFEHRKERHHLHGSSLGRGTVVVDQYGERNLLIAHKRGGVPLVAGADRDNVRVQCSDILITLTQLRGMFTTMQSTEMPQKHQHDSLFLPQIAHVLSVAILINELERTKLSHVHLAKRRARIAQWPTSC